MNDQQTIAPQRTTQEKNAALRRHIIGQVVLEFALPLGSYYGMRAAGVNPWVALVAPAVLTVPFLAYRAIRQRRIDILALFTLGILTLGTVMSLATGDPRTLLVRDNWLGGALGLWVLGTLFTQQPFVRTMARTVVTVKIGEVGHREWDARWDNDSRFRNQLRVLTAVWGLTLALDALVRVALAYSLPVDSVPLVSTLQWLVVLAGLITFQYVYVTRHGLKA
ncbi:VC0807 family protein [Nocardia sp. NPDC051570]|uniref:VC0807 family protein n=1 Tax=Nocardia sp. NPDC051570 TaxID=3364324 RepID=UPI0037980687